MLQSLTAKQLAGACVGMAVAGIAYTASGYVDLANIKGYLVQPNQNISENAGDVVTNVKSIDETSFERLARRAAAVEAQLASSSSVAPQTALNQNAEARRLAREGATDIATANANPTTYVNTNTSVSQYDRLALRAANVAQATAAGHAGAPIYQPNMNVITPEEAYKGKGQPAPIQPVIQTPVVQQPQTIVREVQVSVPQPPKVVIKEVQVPVPSEPKTVIREVRVPVPQPPETIVREVEVPVYGKNLPHSGLGLNLLLLVSFAGAFLMVRPDLRKELVASFARAS